MTDRSERFVVSAIALSLPLAGTITALVTHRRTFEYTTGKVLLGALFELLTLFVGWRILRARGWASHPFRLHFDWTNLTAGFLCAPGYLLLTYVVYSLGRGFVPGLQVFVRHTSPPWLTLVFFVLNSYFEESFASAYLIESFERTGNGHPVTWAAAIRASYPPLPRPPRRHLRLLPRPRLRRHLPPHPRHDAAVRGTHGDQHADPRTGGIADSSRGRHRKDVACNWLQRSLHQCNVFFNPCQNSRNCRRGFVNSCQPWLTRIRRPSLSIAARVQFAPAMDDMNERASPMNESLVSIDCPKSDISERASRTNWPRFYSRVIHG